MALLSINNLCIDLIYKGKVSKIVKNVSFSVNKSEILGIIGESGSGKSLIANSILQLNRHFTIQSGSIMFNDIDLILADNKTLQNIRGSKVGIIFQDPLASLNPLQDVFSQISEAILIHNQSISSADLKMQTEELLQMVDMHKVVFEKSIYPHEISGGQRQRIMIAIAIANKPDILIADEPTTALDKKTQKGIIDLLYKLRNERGMAIVFITHNLSLMRSFADKICVIKKGIIRECAKTEMIYNNPKHKYTKQLMLCNEPVRVTEKPENVSVLRVEGLSYSSRKQFFFRSKTKNILSNISFDLHKKETIGIIGESGAGKSTLVKSLLGIIKPYGDIYLYGQKITSDNKLRYKEIQVVLQDPYSSLDPSMKIGNIVSEGVITHNMFVDKYKIENTVMEMVRKVGLKENIINKYPHECSGGERQRISIARALAVMPSIVVMDECTASLDAVNERRVVHLLLSLQEQMNLSYIFVSHNLEIVKAISHRIFLIKNGTLFDSDEL